MGFNSGFKGLISLLYHYITDAGGPTVKGIGLHPLDCWDCGFESRWEHRYSSLVFAVICVCSVLRGGLITRLEDSYRLCLIMCDLKTSTMRRPGPELGSCATDKSNHNFFTETCTVSEITSSIFCLLGPNSASSVVMSSQCCYMDLRHGKK